MNALFPGILVVAAVVLVSMRHQAPYSWMFGLAAAALLMSIHAARRKLVPAQRRAESLEQAPETSAGAIQTLTEVGLIDARLSLPVTVTGTVRCDDPLHAPFSGKPCAALQLAVDALVPELEGRSQWVAAPEQTAVVPFCISDGSVELPVLPEGAHLDLQDGVQRRFEREAMEQSQLASLLPALDAAAAGTYPPTAYRITERLLEVGAAAHVTATLCERDAGAALASGPEELGHAFVISDASPQELIRRARADRRHALAAVAAWLLMAGAAGWRGTDSLLHPPVPPPPRQIYLAPPPTSYTAAPRRTLPAGRGLRVAEMAVAYPDAWRASTLGDPKVSGTAGTRLEWPSDVQPGTSLYGYPAVRLSYNLGQGWRYALGTPPPALAAIPGRPAYLGMWVSGDGSGNALRVVYVDSTNQSFQMTYGALNWTGWRWVNIRIDAAAVRKAADESFTYYGGAGDGVIHYPIRWQALPLVDPPRRGGVRSGGVRIMAPIHIYEAGAVLDWQHPSPKTLLPAAAPGGVVPAAADGRIDAYGTSARLHGTRFRYQQRDGITHLAYWDRRDEYPEWVIQPRAAGRYRVTLVYAADVGDRGGCVVDAGGRRVSGAVKPTGNWWTFRAMDLGTLTLPAGRMPLTVRATGTTTKALMNLRVVTLTPVR